MEPVRYKVAPESALDRGFSKALFGRWIWAVPFSLGSLEVTGEPFLVAAYGGHPSVLTDGTPLYVPGREETPRNPVWVNRQGEVEEIIARELRVLSTTSLSPDGTRVAYAASANGAGEIWVQDLRDHS